MEPHEIKVLKPEGRDWTHEDFVKVNEYFHMYGSEGLRYTDSLAYNREYIYLLPDNKWFRPWYSQTYTSENHIDLKEIPFERLFNPRPLTIIKIKE